MSILILHIKKFRKFKVERAKIGENQNLQKKIKLNKKSKKWT